ncbi:MAG: tRNA lysidine(34) synthetase TilS [Candidatus Omnitrophota bacterium]
MLIDQVNQTIKKFGLISKRDRVIIGLSGGPDSVALLYLLIGIAKEYSLNLHIAHVDHMLRNNSGRDARFVQALGKKLKIPVTIKKIDIRSIAGRGSIEEVARNQRLAFFFHAANKIKADKIALGHNLDDQAETVAMRLLRGAGLYGLSGILPKRVIKGYTVIRPLIEIRRDQIEAFLRRKKISPRIDETNFEDIYLRNRLRLHLLPLLEKEYNRNIKNILSNTAHCAANDYDYLIKAAERAAAALGSRISLKKFAALHPSMQHLVLRINFSRLKGDTRTLSYRHIQEIEDLLLNRPANAIVDLPSGISVIKKKTYLRFFVR